MRPLSEKTKQEISKDVFFRHCCLTGSLNISLHHVWIWGGRQIDEAWAIVPLRADLHSSHLKEEIRDKCRLISLLRTTDEDLREFSKVDWKQIKKYLIGKYPEFYKQKIKEFNIK